ncbi:hypothetical protein [Roseisolibacter sp. H3M3-2]|uniref:hypothetical protein n=1 Tax=Roseisolibacter sp. H3M3-2 TaxID=3031323 RepID=UPI0023DB229F|nr:hypothetical protein [Roseisolibacter sp. H3M3-2]MDF1503488.1 hypothetical protein [Roseisolibacter sp. H3M3-2]
MIPVDVNLAIGAYPFRHVPHPDPDVLARVLAREGIARGWVAYLPAAFWRDPSPEREILYAAVGEYPTLDPVPTIRCDWPGWERRVAEAVDHGAPAVRAYPQLWGLGAGDASLARLAAGCAEAGLALVLPVRFEDLRQRSALDVAGDLSPAHVRALARLRGGPPLVVLGAGREFIEETAWALTEPERDGVFFDFSSVWGPPEDHLATLLRTLGGERFVFGSGWPLRLTQAPAANLALLPRALRDVALTGGDAIVARARNAARR